MKIYEMEIFSKTFPNGILCKWYSIDVGIKLMQDKSSKKQIGRI